MSKEFGGMMGTIVGWSLCLLFVVLSLLHVFWAVGNHNSFGGTVPEVGGRPMFTPTRFATFVVAAGLFGFALTVLGALGYVNALLPQWLFRLGVWGIAAIFFPARRWRFSRCWFFQENSRHEIRAQRHPDLFAPLSGNCPGLCLGCLVTERSPFCLSRH